MPNSRKIMGHFTAPAYLENLQTFLKYHYHMTCLVVVWAPVLNYRYSKLDIPFDLKFFCFVIVCWLRVMINILSFCFCVSFLFQMVQALIHFQIRRFITVIPTFMMTIKSFQWIVTWNHFCCWWHHVTGCMCSLQLDWSIIWGRDHCLLLLHLVCIVFLLFVCFFSFSWILWDCSD